MAVANELHHAARLFAPARVFHASMRPELFALSSSIPMNRWARRTIVLLSAGSVVT
jgi:hypothetical protein